VEPSSEEENIEDLQVENSLPIEENLTQRLHFKTVKLDIS
jgi:hypothetical protein